MPIRTASGTRGLIKRHERECENRRHPHRCDCPWRGRYNDQEVQLAKWAGRAVDPRDPAAALAVLRRMQTAIDAHDFDPAGERAPLGDDGTTFRRFIAEWKSRHAEKHELNQGGLYPMLGVIGGSVIGRLSLDEMVAHPKRIEDWLDAEGKKRKWTAKTWNGYRDLLFTICGKATIWTANNEPRMAKNPIATIERRVAAQPEHFKQRHLDEAIEADLFAACARLNRPIVSPNKHNKLTPDKAAAIRARLEAGKETGRAIAAACGVSPAVVSSIKLGDIWKPESHARIGTKGTEMERRLIGAFDAGLRAGEMLQVRIAHVNWRLVRATIDGAEVTGYEITLPPDITKGGARSGKPETVFIATARGIAMLERRRFQLKGNPEARTYIWGREDGRRQKGFRRMWRALFTEAGLSWGRGVGLVWHTTRHEYISRIAEQTQDPILTQELSRHKELETTSLYMHARRGRQLAAAAGVSRRRG